MPMCIVYGLPVKKSRTQLHRWVLRPRSLSLMMARLLGRGYIHILTGNRVVHTWVSYFS